MARLPVEVAVEVNGDGDIDALSGKFTNLDKIGTGAMERIGHKITDFATGLISSGISSLVDNIGNSITLASDKAESASKANVLFGDSYGIIEDASRNAATEVGLSSGKYLDLAGTLGNLTTNLGFAGDESAMMSKDLISLATDMGSFNNASTEDVVLAMGAAFRGETEPIRQFGVFLDDARVKAEAVRLGLYDGVGALDANAKAQATYSLILSQTTAAQGDFARTSDGLANQTKINGAIQEEAWTSLGESLMPLQQAIMPAITAGIQGIAGVLTVLADNLQITIPVLGALGLMVLGTVVPPFVAWAAATLAATWPLIAIGAAVAGVVLILDQLGILDDIIAAFQQLANVIMGAVQPVVDAIIGAFRTAVDIFNQVAGVLKGPVDVAIGIVRVGFDVLGGVVDAIVKAVGVAIDIFNKIAGVLKGPVDLAIGVVKGVFDGLVKGIQMGADFIGKAIDGIMGFFQDMADVATDIVDTIVGVFQDIWQGIQRAGQDIMNFLGGLFQPLADAVNNAVNTAKDVWNGFVRFWNGFELVVPAIKVGDFQITPRMVFGLPDLPTLAAGGIVTGPTLALIGEGMHDEAVVPLDGRHGLGGGITVNIYTGVGDPVAIGREVRLALDAYERASGSV